MDKALRDELDEHLDALNQNTQEIASLHEYVSELDMKLDKLAERLDALQSLMLAQTPPVKSVRLTPKEEDVLNALLDAMEPMTSMTIGKHIGLTPDMVAQTLFCLKQKGIPVQSELLEEHTYYAVDPGFRDLQRGRVSVDR